MRSLIGPCLLAGVVAHSTVAKAPTLKASELQREIEHVTSELTKNSPNLRKSGDKARDIQSEVEFMVNRVESLHDSELTSEFTNQIEVIEEAVSKETSDHHMTMEISEVRASLCAQNGFQNHEFAECEAFMRKSCEPKETDDANFVNDEPLEDSCFVFFKQEKSSRGVQVAAAPAPGPAGGPGGAPGPAPMGTLFGGKGLRELPDQGFDGQLVKHVDFDTMNEDWQKEFGPKSGHRDVEEICADFPDNEWCRIHGYHGYPPRETVTVTETETVEVPADEQPPPPAPPPPPPPADEPEPETKPAKKVAGPPLPPLPVPERSGTSACQLTLTALLVTASMFAN